MRISLSFLVLACLLSLAEGRLVFESEEIEFEAKLEDTRSEVVFRFRNEGDEPVKIVGLHSSCGCTVPSLEKRDYAPGESGEIRAMFDFGKRTGLQHKRVRVQTDEVPRGMYQLGFKTTIPVWGSMQPQLGRWTVGATGSGKVFTLEVSHPEKVRVASWSRDLPSFTVDMVEKENGLYEFHVHPKDTAERVTERLEVELSLGEEADAPKRQLVSYCLIR